MLWSHPRRGGSFHPRSGMSSRGFTERTGVEVDIRRLPRVGGLDGRPRKAAGDFLILTAAIPGLMGGSGSSGSSGEPGVCSWNSLNDSRLGQSPNPVSLGTVGADGSWPAERGSSLRRGHAAEREGVDLASVAPELQRAGPRDPRDVGRADEKSVGRLQAEGETPWCMGLESGDADGWPATDWIETLVLADAGAEAYDAWTFHELPFRRARPSGTRSSVFGEMLFSEGSVRGGPVGAAGTFFGEAQLPMLDDPPGCWLYLFPTFADALLEDLPPGALATFDPHGPLPAAGRASRRSDRRRRGDRRVLRPTGGSGGAPIPSQSRAWRGVRGARIGGDVAEPPLRPESLAART